MHTMAKVKNAALAEGDTPEPAARVIGETQIVDRGGPADRQHRGGGRRTRPPLRRRPRQGRRRPPRRQPRPFPPGGRQAAARARLGLPQDAFIPLFAGRIQPLKAPDILLRAAAELLDRRPLPARAAVVPVSAGPAGGPGQPERLQNLAARSASGRRRTVPAAGRPGGLADWFRAASVLVMPSYSESFGLVAIEAQACGTPVVAASVGGLPVAVRRRPTGFLVQGHDPQDYATALRRFVGPPRSCDRWAGRPPGTRSPSAGGRRRGHRRGVRGGDGRAPASGAGASGASGRARAGAGRSAGLTGSALGCVTGSPGAGRLRRRG